MPDSKVLKWDVTGDHLYETGIDRVVLYPYNNGYPKGYAWNGVTGVSESPSGADSNPLYADNIKYLNLVSAEEFGATIEAYTYPDEFKACNGEGTPTDVIGARAGQQTRKTFGLSYRTVLGNDTEGNDHGYEQDSSVRHHVCSPHGAGGRRGGAAPGPGERIRGRADDAGKL